MRFLAYLATSPFFCEVTFIRLSDLADIPESRVTFRALPWQQHRHKPLAPGARILGTYGIQDGMQGRVKRRLSMRAMEERAAREVAVGEPVCALCDRLLGARVEWHHTVPKSEGGEVTVPVHPICHRAIHAHVSNHELASRYAELEALRSREDMQRFLRWIASKPPDFYAPTRRKLVDG